MNFLLNKHCLVNVYVKRKKTNLYANKRLELFNEKLLVALVILASVLAGCNGEYENQVLSFDEFFVFPCNITHLSSVLGVKWTYM